MDRGLLVHLNVTAINSVRCSLPIYLIARMLLATDLGKYGSALHQKANKLADYEKEVGDVRMMFQFCIRHIQDNTVKENLRAKCERFFEKIARVVELHGLPLHEVFEEGVEV